MKISVIFGLLLCTQLGANETNETLEREYAGVVSPILLDPVLEFVESGEPVQVFEFVEIFGKGVFLDSRVNEALFLLAQKENANWVDLLPIFGAGDLRAAAIMEALQKDGKSAGVGKELGNVIRLLEFKDEQLAVIAQTLAIGGRLNVQQVLRLLKHSVPPKIAVLIELTSQYMGNVVSIFDFVDEDGVFRHLLTAEAREKILSVINLSPSIARIYWQHSQVPFGTLLAGGNLLYVSSFLNDEGLGKLQWTLSRSRGLRQIYLVREKFKLRDALDDNIVD